MDGGTSQKGKLVRGDFAFKMKPCGVVEGTNEPKFMLEGVQTELRYVCSYRASAVVLLIQRQAMCGRFYRQRSEGQDAASCDSLEFHTRKG